MTNETDPLPAQVEHARQRLRATREERMAAERAGAGLETVQAAIRTVSRDIDAATSPQVEALMDAIDTLDAEVREHRTGVEVIARRRATMIHKAGIHGRAHLVGQEVADEFDATLADVAAAMGVRLEEAG